jgi:hypothetical protein
MREPENNTFIVPGSPEESQTPLFDELAQDYKDAYNVDILSEVALRASEITPNVQTRERPIPAYMLHIRDEKSHGIRALRESTVERDIRKRRINNV